MLARTDYATHLEPPETRVRRIVAFYRQPQRTDALAACMEILRGDVPAEIASDLEALDPDWADHAIASVYTAILPKARRKALGAFFTPPPLVQHLLKRATSFGVDLALHRLRDPAAGGAAFLVPITRQIVKAWREEGVPDSAIIVRLQERVLGTELDLGLAQLANALLRRCLVQEFRFDPARVGELALIRQGDSLAPSDSAISADHEIGNPPFLRLPARDLPKNADDFADITSGRLNLYAAFVRRGLDTLPAGGLLTYVLPASFLGGPEFRLFRRRVRQLADVLAVDLVASRTRAFQDVVQDTCVLVLRKRARALEALVASSASTQCVRPDGQVIESGHTQLPDGDGPWVLPGPCNSLPSNLLAWGYAARVGYLVANRQKDRLHADHAEGRLPLIWAKAVTSEGAFDFQRGSDFRNQGWVEAGLDAPYVVKCPCVAVQRTSSRGQRRRIAAAAIPQSFIETHGGVIGENHVILLVPTHERPVAPETLAAALNRADVADQLDRMCGSASIPARLLERVPLPAPPHDIGLRLAGG